MVELTWAVGRITGTGEGLRPGDEAELGLNLRLLDPPLGPSRQFTIEVSPPEGAPLVFKRSTPAQLDSVTDLD